MSSGQTEALAANCIHPSRNTRKNLDYYGELSAFLAEHDADPFTLIQGFAKYAPRQTLTDFLVRYEIFKQVLEVPGSVVECGVFRGQGLMSFAQFSAILEPVHFPRKVIGFDTFEGFPEIGEEDRAGGSSAHMREGGYRAPVQQELDEAVRLFDKNRTIAHVPKVQTVKGRVEDTLPAYLEQNPHLVVALLYLDLDLYAPTRFAIETLRPRMPKGAVIAFDELNLDQWPGETQALNDTIGIHALRLRRVGFDSRISFAVLE